MKSDIKQVTHIVKSQVSSYDFAVKMGWSINRYGRMYKCPICGQESKNNPGFVVSKKGNLGGGYHCFYNGHGGDVIDLCMQTNRLEFYEALRWFNDNFALNLKDVPEPTDKDSVQIYKDQRIRNALYHLYCRHVALYTRIMENGQTESIPQASEQMDDIISMIEKLN